MDQERRIGVLFWIQDCTIGMKLDISHYARRELEGLHNARQMIIQQNNATLTLAGPTFPYASQRLGE